MSQGVRIVLFSAIIVAVVGVAGFLYLTRPLADATQSADNVVETLVVSDTQAETASVFEISQEDSTVQFTIDEVLNGQPTTVVGTTSEVAGSILIDFENPTESEVGDIAINARTLATDNSRRNASIGRFILRSEDAANEFITFEPTALSGLPETLSVGDTINFEITGDLTVSGTTQPVTFDAIATLNSEDQLTATAETVVQYQDFGLSIPQVPQVASVGDDVTLTINLVAERLTA